MKNIFLFISLMSILIGCSKDSTSNNPIKENSITCKINGVDFNATGSSVSQSIGSTQIGSTVEIDGIGTSQDDVRLLFLETVTTGDIDLGMISRGEYIIGTVFYDTSYPGSTGGKLTIDKNDASSTEGRFYFNATKTKNPSDRIDVTEGKFVIYH
jgi:hypothetical protein